VPFVVLPLRESVTLTLTGHMTLTLSLVVSDDVDSVRVRIDVIHPLVTLTLTWSVPSDEAALSRMNGPSALLLYRSAADNEDR